MGVLWGAVFSTTISFTVWTFAYLGYIDLGLPQRYEFEKLNNTIRNELPAEYEYTIKKSPFRDTEFESLIVIARDKKAYDFDNSNVGSDIVLLLDKTASQYKISYKFSPIVSDPAVKAPLHAVSTTFQDLDNNNREEMVLGWSYIGASYSPPYITVFSSSSDTVELLTLPRFKNYIYPENFHEIELVNIYDSKQRARTESVHTYFLSKNGVAVVKRSDNACRACSEEHVYNVNYLSLWKNQLIESSIPSTNLQGWKELTTYLEKREFEVSH